MVLRELCAGEVTQTGSRHQETNAWNYGQVRVGAKRYEQRTRNLCIRPVSISAA